MDTPPAGRQLTRTGRRIVAACDDPAVFRRRLWTVLLGPLVPVVGTVAAALSWPAVIAAADEHRRRAERADIMPGPRALAAFLLPGWFVVVSQLLLPHTDRFSRTVLVPAVGTVNLAPLPLVALMTPAIWAAWWFVRVVGRALPDSDTPPGGHAAALWDRARRGELWAADQVLAACSDLDPADVDDPFLTRVAGAGRLVVAYAAAELHVPGRLTDGFRTADPQLLRGPTRRDAGRLAAAALAACAPTHGNSRVVAVPSHDDGPRWYGQARPLLAPTGTDLFDRFRPLADATVAAGSIRASGVDAAVRALFDDVCDLLRDDAEDTAAEHVAEIAPEMAVQLRADAVVAALDQQDRPAGGMAAGRRDPDLMARTADLLDTVADRVVRSTGPSRPADHAATRTTRSTGG